MVIGTGALLGGAAIGGVSSLIGGISANSANQRMADRQMDFQREMSSTQYQRGVKDMKAAGINPMVAYSQGGASAPMGASANMENVAGKTGELAAHTAKMMTIDKERAEAQIDQLKAQTRETSAKANMTKMKSDIITAVPDSVSDMYHSAKDKINKIKNHQTYRKMKYEYKKKYGPKSHWTDHLKKD